MPFLALQSHVVSASSCHQHRKRSQTTLQSQPKVQFLIFRQCVIGGANLYALLGGCNLFEVTPSTDSFFRVWACKREGFAILFLHENPPQIPTYQKKHRVYTNFFEQFARTFAPSPYDTSQEPSESCSEKLVQMNCLFGVDFFGFRVFLL